MKNNINNRNLSIFSKPTFLLQWMAAFSLIICTSCQENNIVKNPVLTPNDNPEVFDHADTIVHKPDSILVPTDSLVNSPDTINGQNNNKKTMTINWSDLDYKQYTFNDKNQLERYYYQYVFVQNDPSKIKYFDYEFSYDEAGKVIGSTYNKLFKTSYEYTNGVLSGAKEYNGYNELSADYSFKLDERGRMVEQIVKSYVTGFSQMKYQYQYNADDNLVQMKQYYMEGDRYLLSLTFEWESFDNSSYMENYSSFSPYIPTLTYWKNNPGKRFVKDRNGNITGAIEIYSYTYDTSGKVTSKTKQVIMDSKTYPSATQHYTYSNF